MDHNDMGQPSHAKEGCMRAADGDTNTANMHQPDKQSPQAGADKWLPSQSNTNQESIKNHVGPEQQFSIRCISRGADGKA